MTRALPPLLLGAWLVACASQPCPSPERALPPPPAEPTPVSDEADTEAEDEREAPVEALPAEAREPLPPLPTLAPWAADDRLLVVDRVDGRTFVVLEHVDDNERLFDEQARDWWDVLVAPSERVVPRDVRIVGEDGGCAGTDGRAVILTSFTMPYSPDGDYEHTISRTHRYSAVEVDADCNGLFATTARHAGRLAWSEPEVTRPFERGRLGPRGEDLVAPVVREPVGRRGRFCCGYRFENQISCYGIERMQVTRGRSRTRFEWEGLTARRFGLLRFGRRDYFAVLTLMGWQLHSLDDTLEVPSVIRAPTSTAIDIDHVEMEAWACLPDGL